jgi:glucose/mannose-6-phosphate isomerase
MAATSHGLAPSPCESVNRLKLTPASQLHSSQFIQDSDYSRTQQRMNIAKNIITQYTKHIYEVWSKGDSYLEKALYLIHFGDWVSFHLAELRKVDPVEVNVIDYLKAELAN